MISRWWYGLSPTRQSFWVISLYFESITFLLFRS